MVSYTDPSSDTGNPVSCLHLFERGDHSMALSTLSWWPTRLAGPGAWGCAEPWTVVTGLQSCLPWPFQISPSWSTGWNVELMTLSCPWASASWRVWALRRSSCTCTTASAQASLRGVTATGCLWWPQPGLAPVGQWWRYVLAGVGPSPTTY